MQRCIGTLRVVPAWSMEQTIKDAQTLTEYHTIPYHGNAGSRPPQSAIVEPYNKVKARRPFPWYAACTLQVQLQILKMVHAYYSTLAVINAWNLSRRDQKKLEPKKKPMALQRLQALVGTSLTSCTVPLGVITFHMSTVGSVRFIFAWTRTETVFLPTEWNKKEVKSVVKRKKDEKLFLKLLETKNFSFLF